MRDDIDTIKTLEAMARGLKSDDPAERAMAEMARDKILKMIRPSVLLGEIEYGLAVFPKFDD